MTCELIEDLDRVPHSPNWLVIGDLNLFLTQEEKFGGNSLNIHIVERFREAVQTCHFCDLGIEGDICTWSNNQLDEGNTNVRLDRFQACAIWRSLYPQVVHLMRYVSNHNPLLLDFLSNNFCRSKKKRIKRFEQVWIRKEEFSQVIKEAWAKSDILGEYKVKICLDMLSKWGISHFGEVPYCIKDIQNNLVCL